MDESNAEAAAPEASACDGSGGGGGSSKGGGGDAAVPKWRGASMRRREAEKPIRDKMDFRLAELLASHNLLLDVGSILVDTVGLIKLADLEEVSVDDLVGCGISIEAAKKIKSGLSAEEYAKQQKEAAKKPRKSKKKPKEVAVDDDGFQISSSRQKKAFSAAMPAPRRAVSAEVQQLVEMMGLDEERASALLRKAEGDVNRAIDLCLAEVS